MKQKDELTSVGIDIGTTSCHLVFSRLSLVNEASATQIPRLVIGERAVLYESPIHFTPLLDDGSIDGARVSELMHSEYLRAGFKPDDINCGAVIITGETASLRNAEQVLHEISSLAGDFVSASAGPELESILAGRGSGALQYSRDSGKTICNIDIGGGTTNVAVFRNGDLIETGCLRIGARCIRFTKQGKVRGFSKALKYLIDSLEAANSISDIDCLIPTNFLESLSRNVSQTIIDFVSNSNIAETEESPATNLRRHLSKPLTKPFGIDEFWFSGGVAQLMLEIENRNTQDVFSTSMSREFDSATSMDDVKNSKTSLDPFEFEDFGWYMADSLNKLIAERNLPHRIASNPIRATVLGAGSYSVQLSGNTISATIEKLPIKGIPLVNPFRYMDDTELINANEATTLLEKSIAVHTQNASEKPVAIVLNFKGNPRYSTLRTWATTLSAACEKNNLRLPYIIVINTDSAMALGQLMRGQLKHNEIIVLDGVDLNNGDFIDIGKPLNNGSTIPVTVKSLVFSNE